MATDYLMPKLAMAMNEGTINEWQVADGARVEKGDVLLTVETEKVAYDLEAPESGFIRILVAAGETVPVESRIGIIANSAAELDEPQVTAAAAKKADAGPAPAVAPDMEKSSGSSRTRSSPAARRLAKEGGIRIEEVVGTGPRGRIVKRDVIEALRQRDMAPVAAAPPAATQAVVPTPGADGLTELARLPLKGTPRAAIARRMQDSLQNSAQLSTFWESDITELRKTQKMFAGKEAQLGTRVSVNAFIVKAMALAVADVPIANASLIDDVIIIYRNVNVGVAISLPGKTEWDSTLMVPVVRNVQAMGVAQIDKAMKELIARARNGKLTAEDMTGSTITLSSTAGLAPPGTRSTPVLNLPNAVLVGPSTAQEKMVVVNGEAQVRTMMPVSMTFDHRVLDGEPAARFINALHGYLENPVLILA